MTRIYRARWRGDIDCAVRMVRRRWDRPADWGLSESEVRTLQKFRGSRLVSTHGIGQCVLVPVDGDEEDGDGGDSGGRPPNLRPMRRNDTAVWDFIVCEPVQLP